MKLNFAKTYKKSKADDSLIISERVAFCAQPLGLTENGASRVLHTTSKQAQHQQESQKWVDTCRALSSHRPKEPKE